MRVVSQNRNYSFDFDRTIFWTQYNIIYARVGTDNIPIGQYESEERAGKVFEDMHKQYGRIPELYKESGFPMGTLGMIEVTDNSVYYMPEV